MNNLNVTGEIIDFYSEHLKGKVGKMNKKGVKYRDHLLLTTNDYPIMKIAVSTKDRSKVDNNETLALVRSSFPYEAAPLGQTRKILIPMCMTLGNKPHHWLLLVFEDGMWIVYNSANFEREYEM
ncbi:hypothetical protein MKW94_025410 [Papaver nudicaule]|uniref:Uncharacterized protein n=1 Tax=Papaver nudicaule TaxID=74823 RepID=A0AA42ATZ0_PAPNU|nr:hypothetical protein [Papaver nudicaule]